jgi:hypothetical protein
MPKNIFVFGLNDANRAQMAHIPGADQYLFHSLLAPQEVVEAEAYEFGWLLDKARRQLDAFEGTVDGITTFWDFPSTELRAVLCQERGLAGPTAEAIVKCSHKYRSRTEQNAVIPEAVPAFEAVNPFDEDPLSKIRLRYPFFLKPVKSYASFLSYYIAGPDDFQGALPVIRDHIARYGQPYNSFLQEAGIDVGGVDATWCIAEETIGGRMCTVEGYARHGEVKTFGLIDSHRFPGRTTFSRYQYPSRLPVDVRKRIDDLTRRIIGHIGYDHGAFNIEFFYDMRLDQLRLLEINPRISQSHSDLFYKVDGAPNQQVIVDLALGREPSFPHRQGEYRIAAKFYLREFRDGIVSHVPSAELIQELEEEFEGALIQPHVTTGQRLGDLQDQEPYSYRLGVMYLGGKSQSEMLETYRRCKEALGFRIRPLRPAVQHRSPQRAAREEGVPRTVTKFPYEIKSVEHVWIPMRDGCRLSARIWYPVNAEQEPVPAILEYIPYRKRDHTRYDDETAYTYLAGHGYACVRVDMRGSGDSEGVLEDEYLTIEQLDGLDVLKWIGEQPWCDGGVGMVGISWGGFNGLQIAALQPPELKAIITVCSTDDRYGDDVHYMGGCLLADNLSWASTMFARNAQPPDPEIVGESWLEQWKERLEGSGLWVAEWMRHPWRDDYWKHGSVCEDFSQIQCPVLAVGGWADGYTNAVFRLMKGLEVPCKGIIGPWSHVYPQFGTPGPAIGFLQESKRWWDYWLKGIDSGIMSEPPLTVWMQDWAPPRTSINHRPGRWLTVPSWPSDLVETRAFWLDDDVGLSPGDGPAPPERTFKVQSPLSVGLFGGKWSFYAVAPDLPHDQREEDGGALVFESEPLKNKLSILGSPELDLELSSNRPSALLAVRLSDVAPDDKATRITFGLLNLTHRDSHEHPEPLEPREKYRVRLQLKKIAQVVPKGHRLRIAISSSYWPIAWPSPEPVRLTIHTGASRLLLPELPRNAEKVPARPFPEPVIGPAGRFEQLVKPDRTWLIQRNMMDETTTVMVKNDEGTVRIADADVEISTNVEERYTYQYDDYDSLKGEARCDMVFERPGWRAETFTRTTLTSTKRRFRVRATLDAYLNGSRVYSKSWDETIPRKLV